MNKGQTIIKYAAIAFAVYLICEIFLILANIIGLIGDGFKKDAIELEKLQEYVNDEGVLQKLLDIKSTSSKAAFIEVFFNTYNPLLNFTPLFLILKIPLISLHKLLQNSLRCLSSLLYFQTSTPLTLLSLAELIWIDKK